MALYKEPINCFWCGDKLQGHVLRKEGKLYCNEVCAKLGEERRLAYLATLAGKVCVIGAMALSIFLVSFALTPKARAHDPRTHAPDELHDSYSDAYGKCCTGDDFVIITTWEPTRNGYRIMYKGEWLDAPDNVVVKNHYSPDGETRAWIYGEPDSTYVRCLLPGAMG